MLAMLAMLGKGSIVERNELSKLPRLFGQKSSFENRLIYGILLRGNAPQMKLSKPKIAALWSKHSKRDQPPP
jgi:hypothetical protein